MSDPELEEAISDFVGAFELVFRYDWEYTKLMFGDEADGASFIEPQLADEFEDWGARGALLEKYRNLVAIMKKRNMKPQFPFPPDRLPDFKGLVW